MIVEYHRPQTLAEALALLSRDQPASIPLAGGTAIDTRAETPLAVVDLQNLGLDKLHVHGQFVEAGATLRLQELLDADVQPALKAATRLEATYNLRHMATLGGTLVAAGGRSPLVTALLALDATLDLLPGTESCALGNFLPQRSTKLPGHLITRVSFPANARLAFETIARTPADQPIVCAAVAVWNSGRTRVALGGYGNSPSLALDGSEAAGAEIAARSAYSQAGDAWASAEYRAEMAEVLTRRCLQSLNR